MADPVLPPPSTVTVNPAPVKSGWQTTELWLAMFCLGMIGWAMQQLIAVLPTLAANPSLPTWALAMVPVAVGGLGWLVKLIWAKYGDLRNELKLAAMPDPAVAQAQNVGALLAGADPSATLAAANR